MNNFEKREAAFKLLAESGVSKGMYAPLFHRFYWRLGLNVKPPHFEKFWINALLIGLPLGILFGLWRWFSTWSLAHIKMSLWNTFILGATAMVIIGVIMAAFYAYDRSKHHIPKWEELKPN